MELTTINILTKNQSEIIKTVLYFDMFQYPLKHNEVYQSITEKQTIEEFDKNLKLLVDEGLVKHKNGFYFNINSNEEIITRRIKGNLLAEKMLPLAHKYCYKVAKFPFISGICISGGLSKKYYDKNSDIDYFVITKPNRLWICRTLFILFYKTLSQKKREFYCLNYFISESDLVIPDNNKFVATELAYLLPSVNYDIYTAVLANNNWYKEMHPNKPQLPNVNTKTTPNPIIKRIIESLFPGKLGNWIDDKLLIITLNHWRKKYPEMSQEDFDLQFRSRKHVCKRHSHGSQNKALKMWQEKISEFEIQNQISLK